MSFRFVQSLMAAAVLGGIASPSLAADTGKTPTVVEMYTSKYCPNCPMAERKLEGVADENPNMLVIFEHVDYWDRRDRIDPYGLADITQRQYDVAGAMGSRAGEVFTPMPILDGQIMVKPPLLFTWGSAMEKAKGLKEKPRLTVSKAKDGSLEAVIPPALYAADREVWVMAVEPVGDTKAWRVRGLVQASQSNGKAHVPAATLPKYEKFVVLMQEPGPGAVVAMGTLGL